MTTNDHFEKSAQGARINSWMFAEDISSELNEKELADVSDGGYTEKSDVDGIPPYCFKIGDGW